METDQLGAGPGEEQEWGLEDVLSCCLHQHCTGEQIGLLARALRTPPASTTLRVNTLHTEMESALTELCGLLEPLGLHPEPHSVLPGSLSACCFPF